MTTKLAGRAPNSFRSTGGARPAAARVTTVELRGHRTAYLWQRGVERDAWLDILARFVHFTFPRKASKGGPGRRTIFPRYHQWDAVIKLEVDARPRGRAELPRSSTRLARASRNTIGWTRPPPGRTSITTQREGLRQGHRGHRPAGARPTTPGDIYQFDHARAWCKIDENSEQLAEALLGESAKIVITTLQKFPFVLGKSRPARLATTPWSSTRRTPPSPVWRRRSCVPPSSQGSRR